MLGAAILVLKKTFSGKETLSMAEVGLIDTHAHICDPVFDEDRKAVLERAVSAGVCAVIAVGESLADAKQNLALSEEYPMLRPAAGLYPAHIDPAQAEEIIGLIRKERSRFIAIGEVGLDYWVIKEAKALAVQKEIFSLFIDLSLELNLPLNVHSRSAGRRAVSLLLEKGAQKVQLHAFDGKASAALPAVEAGYFFSIPPSVVRSPQKQKLVKHLPLSCLLIETDSPVLGPEPGIRNEPAALMTAVSAIAALKHIPEEEVVAQVLENTRRLYGDNLSERQNFFLSSRYPL
jgi:TatD DNase family protein